MCENKNEFFSTARLEFFAVGNYERPDAVAIMGDRGVDYSEDGFGKGKDSGRVGI